MNNSVSLDLRVTPVGNADLHFQVELDNTIIFSGKINQETTISHKLNDSTEIEHCMKFIMSEKQSHHTVVDENNNITADSLLSVSDIAFDGIDITQIFCGLAVYNHDFNGTQSPITDKFFGTMGCNGTVELKFSTPIYLWLLENM
jgi:hypothetical protein